MKKQDHNASDRSGINVNIHGSRITNGRRVNKRCWEMEKGDILSEGLPYLQSGDLIHFINSNTDTWNLNVTDFWCVFVTFPGRCSFSFIS